MVMSLAEEGVSSRLMARAGMAPGSAAPVPLEAGEMALSVEGADGLEPGGLRPRPASRVMPA